MRRLRDKSGKPYTDEHGKPITRHGFRSSAASWGESKGFAEKVIHTALAHSKGDAVTTTYFQFKYTDEKREFFDAWAAFCCGTAA